MKSSSDRARSGVFLKGGVTMRVWAKLIKTDITTFSSIGTVPCSSASILLINISRKSRDFSHGMDRPLLSPFMGLFVCFCIFLVIDIFLDNFFAHIAQCTHIVTRRPKMTAPILATSYFWMIL